MKLTELTSVGLRIFAIYIFIYAIGQSISLYALIGEQSHSTQPSVSLLFYIFWIAVPLIIALIIWYFPNTTTKLFLPKYKSDDIEPVTKSELYIAGIVFLGLFVLTNAVPGALYWITRIYMISRMEAAGMAFPLAPDNIASLVSTFIKLLLGLWLLFGAKGLYGFIVRARSWPDR